MVQGSLIPRKVTRDKLNIAIMVLVLLFPRFVFLFMPSAASLMKDYMWIEPDRLNLGDCRVGAKSNATVWLNMTTATQAWQFYLVYDRVHLKAVRCDYTGIGKSIWSGSSAVNTVSPSFDAHNTTHGYVFLGEVSLTTHAGAGSLAWVEFEIILTPCTESELRLDIQGAFESDCLDSNFNSIPIVFEKPPSRGPRAVLTFLPNQPKAGEIVNFDASASYVCGGGVILSYAWSFGDGVNVTLANSSISHAYAEPGIYTVTLIVVDGDGRTDLLSQQVVIEVFVNLTIGIVGNGLTSPAAGTYLYPYGSQVFVTATPAFGSDFHRWVLDNSSSSSSNPLLIETDANHSLIAEFMVNMPCTGSKKALCVLVEFNDLPHTKGLADIQVSLNQMGAYWKDASYGLLDVSFTLTDWFKLSCGMAYYGFDLLGIHDVFLSDLVNETIRAADADVDFRPYDFVIIVHSGSGQEVISLLTESVVLEETDRIWSRAQSNLSIPTQDGINITKVAIIPEEEKDADLIYHGIVISQGESHGVLGVYAHEFGHLLGLHDLYDEDQREEDTLVGKWDLMADGSHLGDMNRPSYPSAYSKSRLGWLFPKLIIPDDCPEEIQVTPLESNQTGNAIMMSSGVSRYIVEYRLKRGFDESLPDEGIIIMRVDEDGSGETQVHVVDNKPETSTKDDAVFRVWDQFSEGNLSILIVEQNEEGSTLALSSKPFMDNDSDGVVDFIEEHLGTNPYRPDTDNDGLRDYFELTHGTNATNPDTDNDGVADGREIELGTSPTNADSDNDGLIDGKEIELGTSPTRADTDNDAWTDNIDPYPSNELLPNLLFLGSGLPCLFVAAFLVRRWYRHRPQLTEEEALQHSSWTGAQHEPMTVRLESVSQTSKTQDQLRELERTESDLDWARAVGRIDRETYETKKQEILRAKERAYHEA